MKLRVLHLLGSEEDTGGVLSVIRNIQEATKEAGVSHLAWVNKRFVEKRRPTLDLRYSQHLVMEAPSAVRLLWSGWRAFRELRHVLRVEPCDVLHAHSRGPLVVVWLAAAIWRQRVIFANHAYARRPWLYRVAARSPRILTTVLTPNMAAYYGLAPQRGRIEIVSECCGDEFFSWPLLRPPEPESNNPGRVPIRLVGIGNVIRWKRWEIILDALTTLPVEIRNQFRFDHWGPIPSDVDSQSYANELNEIVSRRGLKELVCFHGPTTDVPGILATADWFVLASTNEPCSVALIEALALGVPALVTSSGGNVDIVAHGRTGLLFEPQDAASLATRLREIASRAIQVAAPDTIRESVRLRSATVVAQQLLDLYAGLLGRGEEFPRASRPTHKGHARN